MPQHVIADHPQDKPRSVALGFDRGDRTLLRKRLWSSPNADVLSLNYRDFLDEDY